MRNLIEEAASRLHELQQTGKPDRRSGVMETDPSHARMESSVLPIAGHFPVPMQREPSRVEIDLQALAARGMLTPHSPPPQLVTEYRILKRPLIRNAIGKSTALTRRGRFIMVTSARSGEGKTFNAVNIAMSIAMEMDRSVLLVDADVVNPGLSSLLGLPAGPGLLDVLAGTASLDDSVLRTQVEGLSVLPNGNPDARATELIASESMSAILEKLIARDPDLLLIFDAPPLLTTTEARELASHMGQLLLVVEADRTLQSQVEQALSIVEDVPARMLLLNGVRQRVGGNYDVGLAYGGGSSGHEETRE